MELKYSINKDNTSIGTRNVNINLSDDFFEICLYDQIGFRSKKRCYNINLWLFCKAIILFDGEYPAFTHDIDKLVDHAVRLGESFEMDTDEISDTLTLWESKSRCDPYITFKTSKYQKNKEFYEELEENLSQKIENITENEEDEDLEL